MMDQDKAMFPCGAHLAALVRDDCVTGTLKIPLPFEEDDVLTLEWTRVEGFSISDDFAYQWGYHLKYTHDGAHYLGQFFYKGCALQPTLKLHSTLGAERFHQDILDYWGEPGPGISLCFDDECGFNVSTLMGLLPHPQARLVLDANRLVFINRIEATEHKLEMFWAPEGGAMWKLVLRHEQTIDHGEIYALSYEYFTFDLFAQEMCWTYSNHPIKKKARPSATP